MTNISSSETWENKQRHVAFKERWIFLNGKFEDFFLNNRALD
jgi:hypothetical protein